MTESAAGRELSSAKSSRGDKAIIAGIASVLGAGALYLLAGGIGSLVIRNNMSLSPMAIEGQNVAYVERLPASAFWRKFPFVDRDGYAVWSITAPEGGLVAKLTDKDNNGSIGMDDVVAVVEQFDSKKGRVAYHGNKAVDSDGTEFTKQDTVFQAMILEKGMQQRAKWNSWIQQHYPAIKAKLQEQQKYRQQR